VYTDHPFDSALVGEFKYPLIFFLSTVFPEDGHVHEPPPSVEEHGILSHVVVPPGQELKLNCQQFAPATTFSVLSAISHIEQSFSAAI
jgi:hypothetical protein